MTPQHFSDIFHRFDVASHRAETPALIERQHPTPLHLTGRPPPKKIIVCFYLAFEFTKDIL